MHRVKQKSLRYRYTSFLLLLATLLAALLPVFLISGTARAAGNPLAGASFYVDAASSYADDQAAAWRANRPADAAMMDIIAGQPKALWMGNWTPNSAATAADYTSRAAAAGGVGVITAYNIPFRDCGSYSAGGAASHDAYRAWIDGLAAGIGARRTVVILEPDALPQLDCLDAAGRQARLDSLSWAVSRLKANPATFVYLDAGNKGWVSAANMVPRLQAANIGAADGFSVNVSNFFTTAESLSFGNDLSGRLGGKHYVVDTSRNGQGYNGDWCNPSGRGLGQAPTGNTGQGLADAYLWIKGPGESDGTCNGGPAAGSWWPDYALGLAQRARLGGGGPASSPGGGSKGARGSSGSSAAVSASPPADTGSVLASNTDKASANARFALSAFWLTQAARHPLMVTGYFKVPGIAAGARNLLVAIDGREVGATAVDTRYLRNGYHDLTVSYVDKSGTPYSNTKRLYVQNSLNGWERARNAAMAMSAFPQTLPGAIAIAIITLGAGVGMLLPRRFAVVPVQAGRNLASGLLSRARNHTSRK